MELPNQDKIRTPGENETYKYLGILEADTIKQVEMKDKIQKEYSKRTRKLLVTKLSRRNLIKGMNTWAIPLVRYPGPFLKRIREELKQMDQRTRKLMIIHKALHPRDEVDRIYASRKEVGRGLASIEDSVNASIQRFEKYVGKHERIIKRTGGLGSWRTSEGHPNDSIIVNGQNTEKSPGDLRRLAVTQSPVKNH